MSPSFPPEAWLPLSYDGLRPKNLQLFRKLNAVIFPVAYADKFYADCMQAGRVTQLAYSLPTDMLIGGVACRYEKSPCGTVLYVATLGVLAPYRGRGVGQRLLLRALAEAQKDPAVGEAYCHVQACNSEAVAFYAKFGFAVKETLVGYYRRLPAGEQDALVLSRSLRGWAPPPGLLAIPGDDDTELTLDAP